MAASNAFSGTTDLAYLFMNGNMLTDFPVLSYLPGLSILEIANNKLDLVNQANLLGTDMTVLDVKENNFTSGCPNLTLISQMLEEVIISVLPCTWFQMLGGSESLRNITIGQSNNTLDLSDLTASAPNMTWLSVIDNNLDTIPANLPPTLQYLILNENNLVNLTADMFVNTLTLFELHLYDNEIFELPEDLFTYMSESIEFINIAENNLVCIPTFSPWPTGLRHLHLKRNDIINCDMDNQTNLYNVTIVCLQYNRLSRIPDVEAPNVVILELYGNRINILTDDVFIKWPKLEELNVGSNNLHTVSPDAFAGLVNMKTIKLPYNDLPCVPDVTPVFVSLTELNMIGNEIHLCENVSRVDTATFPVLQDISLSSNELLYIPPIVFNSPNLTELSLQYNKLEYLPDLRLTNPMLESVDIYSNPIVCNCSVVWIKAVHIIIDNLLSY